MCRRPKDNIHLTCFNVKGGVGFDFVAKIRENYGGDGDFSDGLKATVKKRSQKLPWYQGKGVKWNKIKSHFTKVTSAAKFQVSFV